jgi:UDP-glucose 4-epimerase
MADNICISNEEGNQTVLVTGGAGYIGSHTCVKLLEAGKEIVVIDNLCNSCRIAIDRIKEITGKDFSFYCEDLRDGAALRRIFRNHSISGVIHFAGWKAADESVGLPLKYYDNNIVSAV